MYEASEAFHAAVADGMKPQIAMLIFKDAVFTNSDIDVDRGIEFRDYFNLEEDIAIGQTPSNEISFSLFNDNRLLNNYKFGDFLATIGVLITEDVYQQTASVQVTTNNATWYGADSFPFLRRNNITVTQPSFAVKAILAYDNKVWAFSCTGLYAVYDDLTGENITSTNKLNSFMKNKSCSWEGKGIFYNKRSRKLFIYEAGDKNIYEFVPLGWFTAERPKAPDTINIDMTCNDFMLKFDEDMPSKSELGISYPISFGNLLKAICNYVGVTCKAASFINSTATLTAEPKEFETATMRDVLKWIAEAAGGNARMNRDGELIIDWIRETTQVITPTEYETFDPYWYQTKTITKLYNRGSDGSYEKTVGTGNEAYLIQDNPLLKGVN